VKAFLVVLMVLSFGVAAHAQPQAPIEWGEARWLGIGTGGDIGLSPIALMGDTIVFLGEHVVLPDSDYFGTVYSYDNGLTHSGWQRQDTMQNLSYRHQVTGSSGSVHVFGFFVPLDETWARHSTDGGATWQNWYLWCGSSDDLFCTFSHGSWVIGITWYSGSTYATISSDWGQTWISNQLVSESSPIIFENAVALTRSRIVLLALGEFTRLSLSRRLCSGQTWEDFAELPDQPYGSGLWDATVAADTASELVGVASVWGGELIGGDLWFTRSTDGGTSWEPAQMLTEHEPNGPLLWPSHNAVFQKGKLWGVAWKNVQHDIPERSGMYCRFSANHGKKWYPKQRLTPSARVVNYTTGQFIGNRMCVYWAANDSLGYRDFRMAEGIITPDTVRPEVALTLVGPDTIRVGDTLRFEAAASDNDTLSEVRVAVLDSSEQRTVALLSSIGNDGFRGSFMVPYDGLFHYRAEAEDFWENVGTDPDSAWLSFHTEGWSNAPEHPLLPEGYDVQVFPNPCNGWPSLQLSSDWFQFGAVEVTLYNVLGQWLSGFSLPQVGSAIVSLAPGPLSSSASGQFFVRISNREHASLKAFTIVK